MKVRKSTQEKQSLEVGFNESMRVDCLEFNAASEFEVLTIQSRCNRNKYFSSFLAA